MSMPLLDNTGSPRRGRRAARHARRGVGTALLRRVEELARDARTRPLLAAEAFTPPGGTIAGAQFARGARLRRRQQRGLQGPRPATSIPTGDRSTSGSPSGSATTASSSGRHRTPDEYVEDLCAALSSFVSMIPTGDLALEDDDWTPERLRRRRAAQHRAGHAAWFATAAIAPDGSWRLHRPARRRRPPHPGEHRHHLRPARAPRPLARTGGQARPPTGRCRAAVPECRYRAPPATPTCNVHMNAVNERDGLPARRGPPRGSRRRP